MLWLWPFHSNIDFMFWISCAELCEINIHRNYTLLVLRDPITDNIFSSDKRLLLCVTISPLQWRRQGIILIARRIPRVQYDRLKTKCLFLVALPAAVPPTTYPYFGPLMDLNFPSRPIHRPSHGLRSSFEHKPNPSWCLFWVEAKGVSSYCFYLVQHRLPETTWCLSWFESKGSTLLVHYTNSLFSSPAFILSIKEGTNWQRAFVIN